MLEYDEQEVDDESEPEVPIYNRAELIEKYHVRIVVLAIVLEIKMDVVSHPGLGPG